MDVQRAVFIQARLQSRRFPGKMLARLAGDTLLGHVVARVRQARATEHVLVVTCRAGGEAIAAECDRLGVACLVVNDDHADQEDVLGRFVAALAAYPARLVARVCADNPLLWPEGLRRLFDLAERTGADYTGYRIEGQSAILRPNGYFAEVARPEALRSAHAAMAPDDPRRNHVTQYLYQSPGHCLAWIDAPRWYRAERAASVDTLEDLARVEAMIRRGAVPYEPAGDCPIFSGAQRRKNGTVPLAPTKDAPGDCPDFRGATRSENGTVPLGPPSQALRMTGNRSPDPTITLPGGRRIGPGEPCFVVAEIGQNHQGDPYVAVRLMKAAHDAGVDAVKMCKRHLPSDMTDALYDMPYEGPNALGPTYGLHREKLEISLDDYRLLKSRRRYNEWNEVFFATVCDVRSAEGIERAIDPPLYKIASRDLQNIPLVRHVARLGKPVILSTGLATSENEVLEAATAVTPYAPCIVLYCVSRYPAPPESVDLGQIGQLRRLLEEAYRPRPEPPPLVGYSDHTIGPAAAVLAVAQGAVMIEKHVTLNRLMPGSDHAASAEPEELRAFVQAIRAAERLTGPRRGRCDEPAADPSVRYRLGRSLAVNRDVPRGTILTESMLMMISPGGGLGWSDRVSVLGRPVTQTLRARTQLTLDHVTPAAQAAATK